MQQGLDQGYFAEKAEKLKYKYQSPEVIKKINLTFPERNESLSKAIEEALKENPGRRFFVIAGPLHLFKSSKESFKSTEGLKDTIKKYPFVVASPKIVQEKHPELKIKHLNHDYISIPNPFN